MTGPKKQSYTLAVSSEKKDSAIFQKLSILSCIVALYLHLILSDFMEKIK